MRGHVGRLIDNASDNPISDLADGDLGLLMLNFCGPMTSDEVHRQICKIRVSKRSGRHETRVGQAFSRFAHRRKPSQIAVNGTRLVRGRRYKIWRITNAGKRAVRKLMKFIVATGIKLKDILPDEKVTDTGLSAAPDTSMESKQLFASLRTLRAAIDVVLEREKEQARGPDPKFHARFLPHLEKIKAEAAAKAVEKYKEKMKSKLDTLLGKNV